MKPNDGEPPQPSRDPRYASLDLWRGAACLMVVLHHAGFAIDGRDLEGSPADFELRRFLLGAFKVMDLGVPLFFVISGYCIAASCDSHRRGNRSSLGFIHRRLRRIYPPYWAALLVFVGMTAGLDALGLYRLHAGSNALELKSPGRLDLSQWVGNASLTETWRPRVWGSHEEIFTRVAWSLCYEEQFYIVCFLALLLFPRRILTALVVVTGLILCVRVAAWDSGWIARIPGTFVILWHEFALGLAVYGRLVGASTPRGRRLCEAFIVAVLLASVATRYTASAFAAGFALLLIALRDRDDWLASRAWLAPVGACGRRCYSIYLAHLPICVLVSRILVDAGIESFWGRVLIVVPAASLSSLAFCWGFFEVVETRFLNRPIGTRREIALVEEKPPEALPSEVPHFGSDSAGSTLESGASSGT